MFTHVNDVTRAVIGAAMEVHRRLGPGLLESAYQECLCHDLVLSGIPFEYELKLPLEYKGIKLEQGYRVDLVVADRVVVEAKSIEAITNPRGPTANVPTPRRLAGRFIDQL